MGVAQRIATLPRAAKWAIAGAAVVVGYLGVVEPVMDATSSLDARADAMEADLQTLADLRERRERAASEIGKNASRVGLPAMPAPEPDGRAALDFTIATIAAEHDVSGFRTSTRRASSLGRGVLAELVADSEEVRRLAVEVEFIADPQTVTDVIADLEASPAVAAVTEVDLRRADADEPRIEATLVVESWIVSPRGVR